MLIQTHTSLRSNFKYTLEENDPPWPVQPGGKMPVTVEVTSVTYDQDPSRLDYWMLFDAKGDVIAKQYALVSAPQFVQDIVATVLGA